MKIKANLQIPLPLYARLGLPATGGIRRRWLKFLDTTGGAGSTPWPSCERYIVHRVDRFIDRRSNFS